MLFITGTYEERKYRRKKKIKLLMGLQILN